MKSLTSSLLSATLFLLSLILSQAAICQAQQVSRIAQHNSAIKGEIESVIRDEMEKSRNGSGTVDTTGIAERIDEAFPFLDDYINDPSDSVRLDIVSILSRETSPRSLKLITRYLAPSSSAFDNGIRWVYRNYTKGQIKSWGGIELQRALYLGSKADPNPQAIILLSCFGAPAQAELNELRRMYPEHKARFGIETWLSSARITFFCDLSLTQTGEMSALARLIERLSLGSANEMATIMAASKFLDTKPLLNIMVSALQDKRDFRYYRYSPHISTRPRYSRICDIAWGVLRYKIGVDKWLDLNPEPKPDMALEEVKKQARRKFAL